MSTLCNGRCHYCGERGARLWVKESRGPEGRSFRSGRADRAGDRLACLDCYRELVQGVIPCVTDATHATGVAGRGSPLDDDSPWQQNNVRHLEGD